jgi:hypothetical protein
LRRLASSTVVARHDERVVVLYPRYKEPHNLKNVGLIPVKLEIVLQEIRMEMVVVDGSHRVKRGERGRGKLLTVFWPMIDMNTDLVTSHHFAFINWVQLQLLSTGLS